MIFGGFDWFRGVDTPVKPADPQPKQHWSALWSYTAGNQRRQITCGHMHSSEHMANECAKTTLSHVRRYKENMLIDVQPAIRILARARNIKFAGIQQEQP